MLEGVWTVASVRADGIPMSPDWFANARLHVRGDHFTSRGMGTPYEGTLVLDPGTKPKSVDMVITGGHAAGTKHRGIYTISGDRLTMCLGPAGGERPRAFGSVAGSAVVLQVLHRGGGAAVTPSESRPAQRSPRVESRASPESPSRAGPAPGPATALEGEWVMEQGVFNGVAMARSMVEWCKRTNTGDVTVVSAGPRVMLKAQFALDTTAQPWQIDYVNLAGSDKGKKQEGIAELDGDSLRICMAPPGGSRPAAFESSAGDRRSYTAWRRN